MNLKRIVFIGISCFCFQTILAQDITPEQRERLTYKVDIFSTDDEKLQQLWYEDRMDQMKLKGELRENYQKIVVYHAYKMERLGNSNVQLNDEQIRREFTKQIRKLHKDVEDILNPEQLEIHKKSWNAILKGVYQRKNWN